MTSVIAAMHNAMIAISPGFVVNNHQCIYLQSKLTFVHMSWRLLCKHKYTQYTLGLAAPNSGLT